MTDLENGKLYPYQRLSILKDIEWRLEAEVKWQNHLISIVNVEDDMREVKEAAASLKSLMEGLKKSTLDAQAAFGEQVNRGIENAGKLKAAASDLREANQTMEGLLGDTGSNFQPTEASSDHTHANDHLAPPDINGVQVNKG